MLKESYSNYFGDAQLFLSNVDELCLDIPEKPDITLDTGSNCERLVDLFDVHLFPSNIPVDYPNADGIGVVDSNLYYCFDEKMTLQDSYLRFSGIKINAKEEKNELDISAPTCIKGPGILVSRRGACYYISANEWRFVSSVECAVIQPKAGIPDSSLLLLICWLKSNIFIWDLLWNKRSHSILKREVLEKIYIPKIDTDADVILETAHKILKREDEFVALRNKILLESHSDINDEQLYQFNHGIIELLQKNETVYKEFFGITDEEQKNCNMN